MKHYWIKWEDHEGIPRSHVALGYIEKTIIIEELEKFKYKYTYEIV